MEYTVKKKKLRYYLALLHLSFRFSDGLKKKKQQTPKIVVVRKGSC